jgi:hypothetical protein
MKCGPRLMAAVGGVLLLSTGIQADERTRHFPAAKCRYTLPADGWSWSDRSEKGEALFAAVGPGPRGALVTLAVMPAPPSARMDQKFIEGFDRGSFIPGKLDKRGGRLITFLGLPCYQVEGRLADGQTTVLRVFLAHGLGYQLIVVGNQEPVEQSPEFEAIMGGFAFDSPPVLPPPGPSPGSLDRFTDQMAKIATYCLLGAGVLIAWRAVFRRGQPSRPAAR